jgi:hypothetical protein
MSQNLRQRTFEPLNSAQKENDRCSEANRRAEPGGYDERQYEVGSHLPFR